MDGHHCKVTHEDPDMNQHQHVAETLLNQEDANRSVVESTAMELDPEETTITQKEILVNNY